MIKTENSATREKSFTFPVSLKSVLRGVATGYILLVVAFVTLALIYTYTSLPDRYLDIAVRAIGTVSIFAAGFTASAVAGNRGWLHGAVAGVIYSIVRIAAGYAVFGRYVPSRGIVESLLLSVLTALIGGIAGINARKNTRRKSGRRKSR